MSKVVCRNFTKKNSCLPHSIKVLNKSNKKCKNELCKIQFSSLTPKEKNKLLKYYAPIADKSWKKNKYEWLSNIDIDNVMKQIEIENKHFKYYKASPIDYNTIENGECIRSDICNFDIKTLCLNGITQFGFVFNLDKHNEPGSHWVSLFVDCKRKLIGFFDSQGFSPPKQIKRFIKEIKSKGKDIDINFTSYINNNEHQKKNSECGMYSIYFITSMIEEKFDPSFFTKEYKKRIKDNKMNTLRKKYFNISFI